MTNIRYVDHYSLGTPSTAVRYRNATVRIYSGSSNDQFQVVEEEPAVGSTTLTVKRLPSNAVPGSFRLGALRSVYALVALVVFAFEVVFGFQILLYLVFNMLADGIASDAFAVVGAILSVPMFLYSIAGAVSLGWTFVTETWSGHTLLRTLFRLEAVTTDWICFVVFLVLPAVTMTATLFRDNDHWWELTAGIWVTGVALLGAAFGISVVLYEVKVCSELICTRDTPYGLLLRAVHLSQLYLLSGLRRERYLVCGSHSSHVPAETRSSIYSHLVEWEARRCGLFGTLLSSPKRVYSMSEVRDVTPFVTRDNWSLDAMFCYNRDAPMVAVTGQQGRQGTLEPIQIKSTLVCQLMGSALIVILVVALLYWMRMGVIMVLLVSAMAIICCIAPLGNSTWLLYTNHLRTEEANRATNKKNDDEGAALLASTVQQPTYTGSANMCGGNDDNGTLLQVWETVRVTEPRIWVCYALFVVELVFLWLWPAVSLFTHGNIPAGVVFVALGCFAFLRLHFDIDSILTELGPLRDIRRAQPQGLEEDGIRGEEGNEEGDDEALLMFREKARISEVVGKIGRGLALVRWMWGYGFVVAFIFLMAYMAASSEYDTEDYRVKGVTFVPGFHYPPRNESNGASGNLPYPTCHLTKGFTFQGGEQFVRMEDYAFLATMAYAGPNEAQGLLDTWFGPGQVQDEYAFVDQYRTATSSWGGASYKLFSFPHDPGYGVVSIRGSEMMLDWLANVELWSAAALLQSVRSVMPLGQIWTPILHRLAYVASRLESSSLRKVDYYRRITQFVNDALASQAYHTLRITGVSLGGGLAIISGAQTGCSTVAISGPGAMISRDTFVPPLTEEQLNTRILNVIPDRDHIVRIDDPGRLYQRIECRAPAYSLFGCHSMWRSLCEFAYQCGSEGRPIMCWCASKYGYPPPVQSGNMTWDDACANA